MRCLQVSKLREINKGLCVGGPFDGRDCSCLYVPEEYPNEPPPHATVARIFSKNFPEGAIYHWDGKAWIYIGPFEDNTNALKLFKAFGVEPAPPL